jgi:hypothetical protein
MDRDWSAQNIEPQELTGKIFQNKELAWEYGLHTFSVASSKILILNDLESSDRRGSAQNLEPQGLISKILGNKELPAGLDSTPSKIFQSIDLARRA